MEQSLDDLFSGAFSDLSVPALEDEDLDFENLNTEEDKTDNSEEDLQTKEDETLHQEAARTVLYKDKYMAETADEEQTDDKNDEEDFEDAGISVMSMDKTSQEDFTSSGSESEEESSDSGEDEEDLGAGEKPEDLLMSVHCSDDVCYDNKEDKIFAEGQPLALEGTESPQAGNEEQGEIESDEEASYFGRVPEHSDEMIIKGDGTEEDEQEGEEEAQEDSSDSEREHMKIEQEENALARCSEPEVGSPCKSGANVEFLEMSEKNLQDLIAEADPEQYAEKMKDFSGDEHQEAGESFADYPSDFSSCEYVEGGGQNPDSDYKSSTLPCLERAVTDKEWMGEEEATDEEGDSCLYSRDLEIDADRLFNLDVASEEHSKTKVEIIEYGCDDEGQAAESDSHSSSDDETQERRDDELSDNMCLQDLENYNKVEDTQLYSKSDAAFSRSGISDEAHFSSNQVNVADFNIDWDFDLLKSHTLLCEDLLTTEDTDTGSLRPAEDTNSYSLVQKTTSMSYQGSLDDSFFFNTELEASEVSELGQLGDDEYEEERNWEQEQERIKAFYDFYDDNNEENGREERQIKVQFCADPLSQVIHYETDSDRDSLSSSTEEEGDLRSAERSELCSTQEPSEPDDTLQMTPAYDPPDTELPESVQENDLSNTQIGARKHKCLGILKQILKMGLVVMVGPLMFWWATAQTDWLNQFFFF
ncbi:dentin matrix acidic phosphoprotein 1-like isoform X2 [Anabas testudineus]|uniref:dentin matrix acidic phosphoprotein 1-like isoform X2 n=1 Tax=Anabas testudineus TaxID=64144 RepID=UPI000E463FEB|nr:dentin matrix acidic phosphoprotein 1-like isoform X2 [Anabas testudineus]